MPIIINKNIYFFFSTMTDKILKIAHLPKLAETNKCLTSRLTVTLKTKQTNRQLETAKSLQNKKNPDQRIITCSEEKSKLQPKIKRSNKMLAPMVLDPYKSKIKNDSHLSERQKITTPGNLSERKNSKFSYPAPKTAESLERENSRESNHTANIKDIKNFKKLIKNYIQQKTYKPVHCIVRPEKLQQKNYNLLNQNVSKDTEKKPTLENLPAKKNHRCRVSQLIFQSKSKKQCQNAADFNYWNNVLQSDISFRQQKEDSVTLDFLNLVN